MGHRDKSTANFYFLNEAGILDKSVLTFSNLQAQHHKYGTLNRMVREVSTSQAQTNTY